MPDLYYFRKEYTQQGLTRNSLLDNPFEQFQVCFSDALKAKLEEPNAMILATSGKDCRPSARIVLLKDFNDSGFTFFTNYESRKGRNLKENPYASLLVLWYILKRQVRIVGTVQKVSEDESDAYFAERLEVNRIGAWASPQSSEIPSKEYLEELGEKYIERFDGELVPRPANWGSYRLIPDRFEYYLEMNKWKIRRLAP